MVIEPPLWPFDAVVQGGASIPLSPPHPGTGVVGGSRWDAWRTGCPNDGAAAAQPMCQLAWRSGCGEGAEPLELRRLRGRRDRQAQRLARRSSRSDHFKSGPASGLAGTRVAIWPVKRAAQTIRTGQFAKQAVSA